MQAKHSTIRSFVQRAGRLTSGQKNALEVLWPKYGLQLDTAALSFSHIFTQHAPIILEIGFGNGATLVETATRYPEYNFIGIEVHRPGIGQILQLIEKAELNNIKIICTDAVEVLKQNIPNDSLHAIHIFFPDPWHKKRHKKRRLIQENFVALLAEKLTDNGILHIASDWSDYAEHTKTVMSSSPAFKAIPVSRALIRPKTKFEQRGLKLGHTIYDLTYCKN